MVKFSSLAVRLTRALWARPFAFALFLLLGVPADLLAGKNDGVHVFDESRVANYHLTMTAANLSKMLASRNAGLNANHAYVPADIDIDGVTVSNVAVRLKGNSSLSQAQNGQYSLKLDFDLYTTTNEFDGLRKLNIHNVSTEASHLADSLSYGAWRRWGVPAPRTGWADVWVNGKKWGTYTTVEQVGQGFISDHFEFSEGDLYKPESPAGTLAWRGASISQYPNINAELQDGTDHAPLLHFLDVVNRQPMTAWPAVFDIGSFLTYLAGNAVLGNWDCYTEMGHNYYLYESSPGRFSMLPWDMNFSQANTSQLYPPLRNGPGGGGPGGGNAALTTKVLANAAYKQLYLGRFKDFIEGPASKEVLNLEVDHAVAVLSNRLSAANVKTLRNNIGKRVDTLRVNLGKALTNAPTPRLVINELMAANTSGAREEAGEFEDWIEIHNPGTNAIELAGMFLTDDLRDSRKWQFPAGTSLAAGAHLLLWADGETNQGPRHLSFKLDRDGEMIALYDNDARANGLIDLVEFGPQGIDVAFGRLPGTQSLWVPEIVPTPGAANDVADSDGDGLPDAWEFAVGLDPLHASDASGDKDGDGISNAEEFAAETAPDNAESGFRMAGVVRSGADLVVTWQTEPERDYQVEFSNNPSGGNWTKLGLPQRTGSYTDVGAATAVPRFYRVRWVKQ